MRLPETATLAGAWAGAVLFAISIACFLYTYAFTFARPANGVLSLSDLAVNLLLFSGFAFHHSLFARTPVRAWVARMVPPGLERTIYVTIASLLLIVVCLAWRPLPGTVWHLHGTPAVAMYAVQVTGVALTVWSAGILGLRTLAGLSSGQDDTSDLKTRGPYGWVRHPIYAGWLLITLAVPMMTVSRLVFALAAGVYLVSAIPLEEGTMRRVSPERYARYVSAVRWRLVPGVF